MLSANKIIIFLTICFLSSTLNAKDISNFDLNGIKLEMHLNNVINKMPCNAKPKKQTIGKDTFNHIWGYSLGCKTNNESLYILFTNSKLVYSIYKEKTFNFTPDWSKIKAQIINKYGKPDKQDKWEYSWGDNENKIMYFKYGMDGLDGDVTMSINLKDNNLEKSNEKLNQDAWKAYLNKASSIDL